MLAPFWQHLFALIFCSGDKNALFCANLSSILKKIDAETAPSNGAIWDEFSAQH